MVFSLASYVLKCAIRNKFIWFFVIASIISLSLSMFLAGSAVTEKEQFALVFMASSLRLISVLLLSLFIAYYMRQSFDRHEVEYFLSRVKNRFSYLCAHSLAFSFLALCLSIFVTVLLAVLPFPKNQVLMWGIGFCVELLLVTQIILFFSITLRTATGSIFATFGLYVLGRLMGSLLAIVQASSESFATLVVKKLMLLISVLTPRFDLLAQSTTLLYPSESSYFLIVIGQCAILFFLFFIATYFDFKRKEF